MNARQEHQLRLFSGLVMALFLVLHLLNAGLGIFSLSAMNAMGDVLAAFWSLPGINLLLYSAFTVHIGLMFVALYRRRSLRLPLWNVVQFSMALALPILLFAHVAGTRGTNEFLGVYRNYTVVVEVLWSNPSGVVRQYALVILAWTHMSIGIHYWLRHKPGYSRWVPVLYPLCLIIPLLAGLGFLRAGLESLQLPMDAPALLKAQQALRDTDPGDRQLLQLVEKSLLLLFALLLMAVMALRAFRNYRDRQRGGYIVSHTPTGRQIPARQDQTILDTLREAGIAHTSICGGRGRCTTCRVRLSDAAPSLPEPGELERRALRRVRADPNVRLACQLKPGRDVTITPLLPTDDSAPAARVSAGVMGHEQKIACLFVDLRGSTRLGEQKLPYDVVFILNQFFIQLDGALRVTKGHYATFNGDGLMALYGLDGDLAEGCRNAVQGAVEIQSRMQQLNLWLAGELEEPLRVGIGIHSGDAIVGTMGPPDAPTVSALGDTINSTARLEALTKEFNTGLIVSEDALRRAGYSHLGLPKHTVHVRGRGKPLNIFVIDDPAALTSDALSHDALEQSQPAKP